MASASLIMTFSDNILPDCFAKISYRDLRCNPILCHTASSFTRDKVTSAVYKTG